MKKGEVTLTILADFSKAFDIVDYKVLLKELHRLGFSRKFLLLFKDLSIRQQYVQVDDKSSRRLQVEFGVPQGSILGPVLFNLYDTTNGQSTYLVYADDTTLLRHTKVLTNQDAIILHAIVQYRPSNILIHEFTIVEFIATKTNAVSVIGGISLFHTKIKWERHLVFVYFVFVCCNFESKLWSSQEKSKIAQSY